MKLNGSCHCGAVRYSVRCPHPYPYNLCYCGICRKTAGSGGSAINLGARHQTLEVRGSEHIRTYHARLSEGGESPAGRTFCGNCGSALWVWDPRWPDLVHPHASSIDTPLPVPPERTHLMLGSKPDWVAACIRDGDKTFDEYPDESIADWHARLGLGSNE